MLYPKLLLKTTLTTLASSHLEEEAFSFVFTDHRWTSCSDSISVNSLISLWGLGCLCQEILAGLAEVSGNVTYW